MVRHFRRSREELFSSPAPAREKPRTSRLAWTHLQSPLIVSNRRLRKNERLGLGGNLDVRSKDAQYNVGSFGFGLPVFRYCSTGRRSALRVTLNES